MVLTRAQRRRSLALGQVSPVAPRPKPKRRRASVAAPGRRPSVMTATTNVTAPAAAGSPAGFANAHATTLTVAFEITTAFPSQAAAEAVAQAVRNYGATDADPAQQPRPASSSPAAAPPRPPLSSPPAGPPDHDDAEARHAGGAEMTLTARKRRVSFMGGVESPKASRNKMHLKARLSPAIKAKASDGPLGEHHWLHTDPTSPRPAPKRRRSSCGGGAAASDERPAE